MEIFKKKRKGFTLVELVVVVAILGILSAVAVPKLSKSRVTAAISAHNSNVRTLESAATMAVVDGKFGDWGKGDGKGKWEDYLQEWPEVPAQLRNKDISNIEGFKSASGEQSIAPNYTVKIDEKGGITVTPGRLVENNPGEGGQ